MKSKKVIIVGGGAGGLELVVKLCKKFKNNKLIEIILVDAHLKHIWKPMYHEVAAGTLFNYYDTIDYMSYSYQKDFKFIPGILKNIDIENKTISIDALFNEDSAPDKIQKSNQLAYDILVLAIGSQTNDFNIPGVHENCLFLDSLSQAELLNKVLTKKIVLLNENKIDEININIVGGGATGVELAAELNYAFSQVKKYNKNKLEPSKNKFNINVIEAGSRILSALPERVSQSVNGYLQSKEINVLTNTKIISVMQNSLMTSEKKIIKSTITIWAAGIKSNATSVKHKLEINELRQFIVKPTLQTTKAINIFAFGDCASCPQINKSNKIYFVPPRAQAAHQQANLLAKSISNFLNNKSLPAYRYRDYGSLISLSKYNVIGNLMSRVAKSLYIEGFLARLAYWMLYKKHLIIVKGFKYVFLSTISNILMKNQRPEIKLH